MVLNAECWVLGRRGMAALAVLSCATAPLRLSAQGGPPPQPPFAADSAAVLDVARTALHAMRVNDTATMRRVFEGSVPMRIAGYRNSAPVIGTDSGNSWIASVASTGAELLDERMGTPVVTVDGNLAQVWTYYEFHNRGQFSHCGADQFVLGRTPGGWKIISLNYSVRREGCTRSLSFTPRDRGLLDMVAAERAFAFAADTGGTPAAFVWALRDDAITLDGDGVKPMKPLYASRRRGPALLSWGPSWAEMSADGTMGFTLGPWTWRPARDSAVSARGHFMTIWVKGPERWQVALDLGAGGDSTSSLAEPLIQGAGGVTGTANLEGVLSQDRRIAGRGWLDKLRAVTATDARILREGIPMASGPAGVTGPASVTFRSLGGRVAPSGDIAATWGTYTANDKKGAYVRFWRRTTNGWRVTVDRMAE